MKEVIRVLTILLISQAIFALDLPIKEHTFDNGLKLLVVTDSTLPIVSCRLYYFTGSMYEGPGTSGLSHMYEHMMFKGTKRLGTFDYNKEVPFMQKIDSLDAQIGLLMRQGVAEEDTTIQELRGEIFVLLGEQRKLINKDEIWSLYQKNGGTGLNAWTSSDLVAYIVTLPYNKVELFANIEADRMQNVVLREFYSERDVVTEERRMRYENKPTNNYFQHMFSLFYIAHPYRIPTIGWYSDIRNYTREKLQNHIAQYYRPDNAMIVLAGNIQPNEAIELIGSYFEKIPNPTTPPDPVVTKEPAPLGITRFEVEAEASPRVDIIFHTPGYGDSLLPVLDVVESMLNGKSGRLYKRLVLEENLALSVSASNAYMIDNGYFHIGIELKDSSDHKLVENIVLEEINKLTTENPSEQELLRVKNSIRLYFLNQLQSMESLSNQLASFEKLSHWRDILSFEEKIEKVDTTIDAVKLYLNPSYRTVGYLISVNGAK